jgi:hypothetical protein
VRPQTRDGGVQPAQHGGRAVGAVVGDAAQQPAQLGHVGGGLGVVPDDVADDDHRSSPSGCSKTSYQSPPTWASRVAGT